MTFTRVFSVSMAALLLSRSSMVSAARMHDGTANERLVQCSWHGPMGGPDFQLSLAMKARQSQKCSTLCQGRLFQLETELMPSVFNAKHVEDQRCSCMLFQGQDPFFRFRVNSRRPCTAQMCWNTIKFVMNHHVEDKHKRVEFANLKSFSSSCKDCPSAEDCPDGVRLPSFGLNKKMLAVIQAFKEGTGGGGISEDRLQEMLAMSKLLKQEGIDFASTDEEDDYEEAADENGSVDDEVQNHGIDFQDDTGIFDAASLHSDPAVSQSGANSDGGSNDHSDHGGRDDHGSASSIAHEGVNGEAQDPGSSPGAIDMEDDAMTQHGSGFASNSGSHGEDLNATMGFEGPSSDDVGTGHGNLIHEQVFVPGTTPSPYLEETGGRPGPHLKVETPPCADTLVPIQCVVEPGPRGSEWRQQLLKSGCKGNTFALRLNPAHIGHHFVKSSDSLIALRVLSTTDLVNGWINVASAGHDHEDDDMVPFGLNFHVRLDGSGSVLIEHVVDGKVSSVDYELMEPGISTSGPAPESVTNVKAPSLKGTRELKLTDLAFVGLPGAQFGVNELSVAYEQTPMPTSEIQGGLWFGLGGTKVFTQPPKKEGWTAYFPSENVRRCSVAEFFVF